MLVGIPLNRCSGAILLSIISIYFLFYLLIYSFFSTGNICICNTEENSTATCIEGKPSTSREHHSQENSLVQVVAHGSLFSQIS